MSCCHYALVPGNEAAFSVDLSAIVFGPGVLADVGEHARGMSCRRVAVFTDRAVALLEPVKVVTRALRGAGLDAVVFDEVHVEPTDRSFLAAADFAREGRFDGYVSVGGGSVIDTCKAAILHATYPAEHAAYVNRPIEDRYAAFTFADVALANAAVDNATGGGASTLLILDDYDAMDVQFLDAGRLPTIVDPDRRISNAAVYSLIVAPSRADIAAAVGPALAADAQVAATDPFGNPVAFQVVPQPALPPTA